MCPQLGDIRVASTAIHFHLLHSHRLRSRPDQIQNPKSKRAVWILEFGFWILDLDFGFWISLVFVLFVAAPNGAVWILDFGFGLGLLDTVWSLRKIFPCPADSGRRIGWGTNLSPMGSCTEIWSSFVTIHFTVGFVGFFSSFEVLDFLRTLGRAVGLLEVARA